METCLISIIPRDDNTALAKLAITMSTRLESPLLYSVWGMFHIMYLVDGAPVFNSVLNSAEVRRPNNNSYHNITYPVQETNGLITFFVNPLSEQL